MCERLRVRNVVHANDFDVAITERSAKDIPADAPKTVDADFHWHASSK
jgi:hypothetical protein